MQLPSEVVRAPLAPVQACCRDLRQHHLSQREGRLQISDGEDDLCSKLLTNSKGEDLSLSADEILAECSVMMNTGTDTTTAALTNTLCLLYEHPDILAKLRQELDGAAPHYEVTSCESIAKLPCLRASIKESLRVWPASSLDLPRVLPGGRRAIAGRLSKGSTISWSMRATDSANKTDFRYMQVLKCTFLRNADTFEKPEKYNSNRRATSDK